MIKQAYVEGFVTRCRELGVNPEALLQKQAAPLRFKNFAPEFEKLLEKLPGLRGRLGKAKPKLTKPVPKTLELVGGPLGPSTITERGPNPLGMGSVAEQKPLLEDLRRVMRKNPIRGGRDTRPFSEHRSVDYPFEYNPHDAPGTRVAPYKTEISYSWGNRHPTLMEGAARESFIDNIGRANDQFNKSVWNWARAKDTPLGRRLADDVISRAEDLSRISLRRPYSISQEMHPLTISPNFWNSALAPDTLYRGEVLEILRRAGLLR